MLLRMRLPVGVFCCVSLAHMTHHAFFSSCCRYNPRFLAFSAIFFHSVLSLLSFLHPLILIVWISSSASSIHLFLGRPLILLPIGFHSTILLGILPPSIRITCPRQVILLLFINLTVSALPISSFKSRTLQSDKSLKWKLANLQGACVLIAIRHA